MRSTDEQRATRAAYDAVAADYARLLPDLTAETPLDRAVLAAFAEMVDRSGDDLVADVGCGTGRLAAHLSRSSLRILGLDPSPGMVATARSAYPDLEFSVADARALPVRSGSLAGVLAWYSLIHLPTDELPEVFAEFARVLRPGAPVLVAFQSGEAERVVRPTSYGRPVALTYVRHRAEVVAAALDASGFALHATVRREQMVVFETTPQTCLLAHRR